VTCHKGVGGQTRSSGGTQVTKGSLHAKNHLLQDFL
jgi:hypothetical protein